MKTELITESNKLKDENAERSILRAILRDPKAAITELRRIGFSKGDMYFYTHQKAFDLFSYVANGKVGDTILVECFMEACYRHEWFDRPDRNEMIVWLVNIWDHDYWASDIVFWDSTLDSVTRSKLSYDVWLGSIMAQKVMHLASRRRAIGNANELISDAIHPTGGSDYLNWRSDSLGDG